MKDLVISKETTERAVAVGLITPRQPENKVNEYLDELEFLADTAGAEVVTRFVQKLEQPNPRTFVGQGKLAEIKEYVEKNDIGMVIFDDDLSTKQIANIEKELQVKILDRSSLILDIFARRAQTATAKTQVELAQYQYLLPRLTRMWTHLERQKGGIGMRARARHRSRPTDASSSAAYPGSRSSWPTSTARRPSSAKTAANSPAWPWWATPT